jgi:hypothetical protein
LVAAWWSDAIGPGAIVVLSVLVTAYFAFRVPVWCGAVNRDGTLCRRNASGLLLGCGYRQHKWQKIQMAIVPQGWRKLNRGLWSNPTTGLATISALVSIASTVVGLGVLARGLL